MAMPNSVKMFPRGYSGGQSQSTNQHSTRSGDRETNDLWNEYTAPENHSQTWAYRKRVIQCAKRLFGGRPSWFLSQDVNPMVVEYNYHFVLDTIRYIATGYRRISIHAWPDLLANHPKAAVDEVRERHDIADAFEQLALTTSADALIQAWCKHPHGFDDMICTLNLLFGDLPLRVQPQ